VAEELTLYIGLKKGELADFEIVGLAAAAFAEAVKDIAYVLEPGIEVRLEFESGETGSLKLKALLKSLSTKDGQRGALVAVLSTVGLVLTNDVRTYGVGKLLDRYLLPEQRQQLSDEDIERIAKAVKAVSDGKLAKAPVQEMYKQLDRDEAVESVGSITNKDDKPIDPVPREKFPARAGLASNTDELDAKNRRRVSTELLTLISPVFLNADRVWRFSSAFGEHSYHIADLKFLSDALCGTFKMKEGVQITAQIEALEELEGGVWRPKRRTILKVLRKHRMLKNKGQRDLFADAKKAKNYKHEKAQRPKTRATAK
jgi:hypothetical protein